MKNLISKEVSKLEEIQASNFIADLVKDAITLRNQPNIVIWDKQF